jgi:hypothetical protein
LVLPPVPRPPPLLPPTVGPGVVGRPVPGTRPVPETPPGPGPGRGPNADRHLSFSLFQAAFSVGAAWRIEFSRASHFAWSAALFPAAIAALSDAVSAGVGESASTTSIPSNSINAPARPVFKNFSTIAPLPLRPNAPSELKVQHRSLRLCNRLHLLAREILPLKLLSNICVTRWRTRHRMVQP